MNRRPSPDTHPGRAERRASASQLQADPLSTGPDGLASLTRGYARFSHSAAGLGNVIGGGLALVAYLVGALFPPDGMWGSLALASTPFLWIAMKEGLRHRYYQSLGHVRERQAADERRLHLGLTVFTAIVSAGVVATVATRRITGGDGMPSAGDWGYLVLVFAMPWLVWRFMRTPLEFVVGVFLVSQAALALAGSHYALWQQPQAPIVAVILMGLGWRQHREFLRIRSALAAGERRS